MKKTSKKSIISYFRKNELNVTYSKSDSLLQVVVADSNYPHYQKYLSERGFKEEGSNAFVNDRIDLLVALY